MALALGAIALANSEQQKRAMVERSTALVKQTGQRLVRVASGLVASEISDETVRRVPEMAPALKRLRNDASTVAALLETLDYVEQLPSGASGESDRERQVADLSLLAGIIYATSSRHPTRAEPLLQKAVNAWQRLMDRDNQDAEAQTELANSYYFLGVVYRKTNQLDQVENSWRKSIEVQEGLVERFPTKVEYASNLGRAYYNMGVYASQNKKPDDVVSWQSKAIRTLQPFALKELQGERWFLASAYTGRGLEYMKFQKHDLARADFEQSVALTDDPAEKRERRLKGLAHAYAHCGDHAKAVAEAEKAVGPEPTNGEDMVGLANVLAAVADAAQRDNKIPPAEAARLADQYAARAVQLLRKAYEANFFTDAKARQTLREDPGLASLRGRSDFRNLCDRIEKAPGAGKQQPPVLDNPRR
jgi:tetratricopeptide (TPR) repeat protein